MAEWFGALPQAQQAAIVTAFVAVIGVLTTAAFTFFTAVINMKSAITVKRMAEKHERDSWKRSKLWDAYAYSLENANSHSQNAISTYAQDLNEMCYYIDSAMLKLFPAEYTRVMSAPNFTDTRTPDNLYNEALKLKSKAIQSIQNLSEKYRPIDAIILSDDNGEEAYSVIRDFTDHVSKFFNSLMEDTDRLMILAHEATETKTSAHLEEIRRLLVNIPEKYLRTRSDREKIRTFRLFLAERMRRL
ncbi:hypothetical protein [Deinococcus soli (ex Cha et al. 2016)]|uniref:hypothetical protein n=1 Tax=Deinococcus soli (ex Cha et al. 2016) TaxID=1309411 RepID=UPI0016635BA5|nr:hypothetical protein [Deinococcus soli (ex Cha et al. 2016)]GGB69210.1 hypothetical protein GCM10008019_26750 [Deinococcus soli (ex Cha et al. 2016)]